jgi:acetylornithine/N-succinyldiaminopimelate aminotransferase
MTMTAQTEHIINLEQRYVVQTYKRPPFVLSHGEGVTLYDSEGRAYLDMVAGIAVNALGYGDPDVTAAIQSVAGGLLHVSNLYHTAPHAELAALLVEKSFADRVFFCNSGAEANEGAIKFARKMAYSKGLSHKTETVCFAHAFHGRTIGTVSLTPKEKYQKPFRPLMPGVIVAEFNDIEAAKAVIGANTAAVIVEPVQGEGGINPASPSFLQALRELCDAHEAVLIFDEVQCGMGRTGKLWAYEHSGVTPDVMTLAKPLAAGLPIGAILVAQAVADVMQPGDHGSTFAGGPLVTHVAKVVLEKVSQPQFLAQISEVGEYLMERLTEINSPLIKEVRGRGLMVGVEFTIDVAPLVSKGYEHGLLLVNAGENVLRFVPPLIFQKEHADILVNKLAVMLREVAGE